MNELYELFQSILTGQNLSMFFKIPTVVKES
jgi:hypothetical protein